MKLDKMWTSYLLGEYILDVEPLTCDSKSVQLPKGLDLKEISESINNSKKLKTHFGESTYVTSSELYISIQESLPLFLPYRGIWNKLDDKGDVCEIHEVQGTMKIYSLGEYFDFPSNERCDCTFFNEESKSKLKVYC